MTIFRTLRMVLCSVWLVEDSSQIPTFMGTVINITTGDQLELENRVDAESLSPKLRHNLKGIDSSASLNLDEVKPRGLDRVECNYDVAAESRNGPARFTIADLNVQHCTHLYYDAAPLEWFHTNHEAAHVYPKWWRIDYTHTPRYAALNDHKIEKPDLKTFVVVTDILARPDLPAYSGGERARAFGDFIGHPTALQHFSENVIYVLRLWGFDGLIIRWALDSGPRQLEVLLGSLRVHIDSKVVGYQKREDLEPFLLGVLFTTGDGSQLARYDMHLLSDLVDYIVLDAVTSLNRTSQNSETQLVLPLYATSKSNATSRLSLDEVLQLVERAGVIRAKLNVVLSLTGQAFRLQNHNPQGPGAKVLELLPRSDGGRSGDVYSYELCQLTSAGNGTIARASSDDLSVYWQNKDIWISFEDPESLTQKMRYLRNKSVGGVALLSQSEDDFSGMFCGLGRCPFSRLVFNHSELRVHLKILFPWQQFVSTAGWLHSATVTLLVLQAIVGQSQIYLWLM